MKFVILADVLPQPPPPPPPPPPDASGIPGLHSIILWGFAALALIFLLVMKKRQPQPLPSGSTR